MSKVMLYLSLAAAVSLIGCSPASNAQAETAATAAAEAWLSLIDNQRYDESWEQAAQLFKGAVPKEQWVRTVESVRAPFGRNVSRELRSAQYSTSLPGAPDGEYVVIQFAATFENRASAIETITPMLDQDGQWRVSGYFVK